MPSQISTSDLVELFKLCKTPKLRCVSYRWAGVYDEFILNVKMYVITSVVNTESYNEIPSYSNDFVSRIKFVHVYNSPVEETNLTHIYLKNSLQFSLPTFLVTPTEVSISGLPIVNVEGLRGVRSVDVSLCKYLKNVEPLYLARKINLRGCVNVTDVSKLGNAKKLDISDCVYVTDISALAKVEKLNISGCVYLNDVSMLTHVKKLKMSRCYGIFSIAGLAKVQKLNISGSINITEIPYLKKLKIIDMGECYKVTDVSNLRHLDNIDLSCCYGVTDISPLEFVKDVSLYKTIFDSTSPPPLLRKRKLSFYDNMEEEHK